MQNPPFPDDSTDALIASRLPAWLTAAPLHTLYALHESQRRQQQLQQQLHDLLAQLTPVDVFAAPLLQHALQLQHQLTLDVRQAKLRRRTLQRFPSHIAYVPDGVKEQVYEHSLLQSALHNFTEAETFTSAIMQGTEVLDATGQPCQLSPKAFFTLCRSLDLGGQYQAYLRAQLAPDGEAGRLLEALIEEGLRANLEAALRLSLVNGEIAQHAYEHCAALVALFSSAAFSASGLRPMQLRVFGQRVRGAVAFEVTHQEAAGAVFEGILCWIPDDPQGPLTWYATWDVLYLTLGKQFRLPGYVKFFQRFIGARDLQAYVRALDKALKATDRDVPVELDGRHEAIERPLFEYLRKQQIDTLLDNAKVHAVPTAEVDAQVRDRRLHFYLSFALDALGLASFALPLLALPLLGITALQVADEVYEGYADWRLGDRQGALEHLYAVAETVAMTAVNVGAGAASHRLARVDQVDALVPVLTDEGALKLCDPDLPGYAVRHRGDVGSLVAAQGAEWVRTSLASHLTSVDVNTLQRRIRHPLRSNAYAPLLESNGAGSWQHSLETPAEWHGPGQLFRDLKAEWADLDEPSIHSVMRATGFNEDQLRRLHVDHAPPPARLLDALQRQQLHARMPGLNGHDFELRLQAQQAPPSAAETVLVRDFPGLSVTGAREIIAQSSESLIEQMRARQRVPLALAECARWYVRDTRLDRACAGLLQDAAINRDTEQLALGLIADQAPWRGVRIELRSDALGGERIAWAGAQAANEVRTVLKTAQGYQALDANAHPLPSAKADDSLFQALLLQLDPWQKRALGNASDSPQALAESVSLWASEQRDRAALLLGMAPIGLGFRPPVRLGDGRLGYPLSGRGESSNRALRRGVQQLFPDADENAMERFTADARNLGLTPWNHYLNLCEALRALDRSLGAWRRQASGPIQMIRRARMARRIRHAWRRRVRDATGNLALILDGARLGSLPALPETVNFDHVTTLTLTGLALIEIDQGFLARFPNVQRLDLSSNRLTAIPDTAAQTQLVQIDLRANRIVDISEAQASWVRAHPDSMRLEGNPLSAVALERLAIEPAALGERSAEQWFEGLDESQATRRRNQWQALEQEAGSGGFFALLDASWPSRPSALQAEELRRRVGELLNAMYHHADLRRTIFQQASAPRGTIDLDALTVSLQVALRTDGLQGPRLEQELRSLGRELFRLDQVNRFVARRIEGLRLRAVSFNPSDIYLAYRAQLAEPLGIYDQPTGLRVTPIDHVTADDLIAAEAAVYEAETCEALSQFLAQQAFWQDHVRVANVDQFAAIQQAYADRRAALAAGQAQGQVPEADANRIAEQRREEEQALSLALARGSVWTWYRLDPPHEHASRAFAYLSKRLQVSLDTWRGPPDDPEYAARTIVADVLRAFWHSNYREEGPSLGSTRVVSTISSLPALPPGIMFERLRTLSLRNQQLSVIDADFLRRFPHLEDVDLSGNRIATFGGLEHLPLLRRLNLGGNRLETLAGLEHSTQLTDLDLSGNHLALLPSGVEQLAQLTNLDLTFNQIAVLDERIGQLANLDNLQLGGNLLSTVPSSLGNLTRLRVLNLGANRLQDVPEPLNQLSRLTQLYLQDNFIALDEQGQLRLEWFSRLEVLSLEGNPLGVAPQLRYNPQLRFLSLRGTGLRILPLALLQRYPDMVVDLRGNRIGTLSEPALSWVEAHPDTVNLELNPLSDGIMGRIRQALSRRLAERARVAELQMPPASRRPRGRRG